MEVLSTWDGPRAYTWVLVLFKVIKVSEHPWNARHCLGMGDTKMRTVVVAKSSSFFPGPGKGFREFVCFSETQKCPK